MMNHREYRISTLIGLVIFILTTIFCIFVHLFNRVYPYDDAYIIYRYVDNFVAGKGLVYNLGQRVFGISTPLYTLWIILLKKIAPTTPTPALAVRMNAVFYIAGGIGMFFLLQKMIRSNWLSLFLSCLFMLRNRLLYVSLGGMESFMFTALILWSLWAVATGRFDLAGILAGLSVLARPEGIFLAGIVLTAWLILSREKPIVFLTGLVLPGVIWLISGLIFYGTPIYHSIIAKAAPLYPLPPGSAMEFIWKFIKDWSTAGLFNKSIFVALPLLGLSVLGFILRPRLLKAKVTGAWPSLILFGIILSFYFLSNPLMFYWYFPSIEALWFVMFSVGIIWFASWIGKRVFWLRYVSIIICLFVLGYPAINAPVRRVLMGRPILHMGIENDAARMRIYAYKKAAEWLNKVVPDGTVLAAPEIGSLGYYYNKGPIIDACGLISPEAIPFLPVPIHERYDPMWGAISLELVQTLLPDMIVTLSVFADLSLYDSNWFQERYVNIKNFPLPHKVWGSKEVNVFFRGDWMETTYPYHPKGQIQ